MKTFTYGVDDSMVCSTCQSNDKVHYNLVAFHADEVYPDPDVETWCGRCEAEANMVDPSPEFPYEEIRNARGDYFDSWDEVLAAGYEETQIWCVTSGESEQGNWEGTWFCYDNNPHFVNVLGFMATKEHAKPGEQYNELLISERL